MREDLRKRIKEEHVVHSGCRRLVISVILILMVLLAAFLLPGCRTKQHIEQLHFRDSTVIHIINDTTHVTIYDTAHIEVQHSIRTSEGTTIEFCEGGGTYNSHTGEAANVRTVHEEKNAEQDMHTVIDWKHQTDSMKVSVDSLNERISNLQAENQVLQETSVSSGWHSFLVRYFFITAILVIFIVAAWLFKKFYLHW